MCVRIQIGDKTAEDMTELINLIGESNIVNKDGTPPEDDDEFCLCGIDVQKTAEKAGYTYRHDDRYLGYVFERVLQ